MTVSRRSQRFARSSSWTSWHAPRRSRPRAATSSGSRSATRTSRRRPSSRRPPRTPWRRAAPTTRSRPGLPDLREALRDHYRARYDVAVDPENIVVTQGTSPAMLLMFGALLDPGDEVIMPDPCYPAYPNYVTFLGAVPKLIRTRAEDGFRYRLDEVRAAIGPRTKSDHDQLARQPHRRRARRRRPCRARATRRGDRRLHRERRDLPRPGLLRPGPHDSQLHRPGIRPQRLLEGVRDDRLASRLPDRAARVRPPRREDPAELLPCREHLRAAGGCRGAHARAARRRAHARPVRRAAAGSSFPRCGTPGSRSTASRAVRSTCSPTPARGEATRSNCATGCSRRLASRARRESTSVRVARGSCGSATRPTSSGSKRALRVSRRGRAPTRSLRRHSWPSRRRC